MTKLYLIVRKFDCSGDWDFYSPMTTRMTAFTKDYGRAWAEKNKKRAIKQARALVRNGWTIEVRRGGYIPREPHTMPLIWTSNPVQGYEAIASS